MEGPSDGSSSSEREASSDGLPWFEGSSDGLSDELGAKVGASLVLDEAGTVAGVDEP
ncbi:MAG TPA: hypothetical protein VF351_04945 [Actinomycetota bacterium]